MIFAGETEVPAETEIAWETQESYTYDLKQSDQSDRYRLELRKKFPLLAELVMVKKSRMVTERKDLTWIQNSCGIT